MNPPLWYFALLALFVTVMIVIDNRFIDKIKQHPTINHGGSTQSELTRLNNTKTRSLFHMIAGFYLIVVTVTTSIAASDGSLATFVLIYIPMVVVGIGLEYLGIKRYIADNNRHAVLIQELNAPTFYHAAPVPPPGYTPAPPAPQAPPMTPTTDEQTHIIPRVDDDTNPSE